MNWLGVLVQQEIGVEDVVLDLGCGIMQATTDVGSEGTLSCKSITGVEADERYIKQLNHTHPEFNIIHAKVQEFTPTIASKSFDIVMALDLVEHLEQAEALALIDEMMRIAKKKVIIYTPSAFHSNEENVSNAWGMGLNILQRHLCFIPPDHFIKLGFEVSFPPAESNTLAILRYPDNSA